MAEITEIVRGIRNRAAHSRRVHNLNVVIMLILVLVLVGVFFVAGAFGSIGVVDGSLDSNMLLISLIGGTIVRIGAVAIGIFGVQIMFNFARYHIRLAHHLESSADALELSGENFTNLDILQKVLAPVDIDFGKSPTTPTDKLLDVVHDLVKKVPTK